MKSGVLPLKETRSKAFPSQGCDDIFLSLKFLAFLCFWRPLHSSVPAGEKACGMVHSRKYLQGAVSCTST